MRETALALAKSSAKVNEMFGSAEDAVLLRGRIACLPATFTDSGPSFTYWSQYVTAGRFHYP